MKVIGFYEKSFTGSDGTLIEGVNIYYSFPLKSGTGFGSSKVFVSSNRLSSLGYYPSIDDDIEILYDRYGKISGIRLIV